MQKCNNTSPQYIAYKVFIKQEAGQTKPASCWKMHPSASGMHLGKKVRLRIKNVIIDYPSTSAMYWGEKAELRIKMH